MTRLRIPSRLDSPAVRGLRRDWPESRRVVLSFADQRFVLPAGTVGLACMVQWARRNGQEIEADFDGCENAGYWERMDFCALCGFDGMPAGPRHPAGGRFSELRRVDEINDVEAITEALVSVTAPDAGEAFRIHGYLVSEALNNVCQHSEATGFCASQLYLGQGTAHFAIADTGIGLRQALGRFGPANDAAALELALQVGVSGRSPAAQAAAPRHMRNRGIGLSALTRLIKANGGSFTLWSGNSAMVHSGSGSRVLDSACWPGVFLSAIVPQVNFDVTEHDIIEELGPELRQADAAARRTRFRRQP